MTHHVVYWEDVTEGQDIGSYSIEMTAVKVSGGAWATRDSNPIHHDKDFALKAQQKNIIVNIMHSEGILSRLATNCCAGDTMTVSGSVMRKWIGGDDEGFLSGLHLVELQIDSVASGEPFCNAQITMALPSKGG